MPPGAKSRAGVSAHWLAEARLARLTPDVRGRAQKPPLELIYPQEVSAIIAVASSVRVGCGQDRPVSGCWARGVFPLMALSGQISSLPRCRLSTQSGH